MKLKIKFSKNIIATCVLLQTFSDYGLKLLNSNTIAQDENNAIIQNHLNVNENNLPPWILTFELFNKSMNNIFQLRKKQEIGYLLINNAGTEIQHAYRKGH